jgi:hypothetical protein
MIPSIKCTIDHHDHITIQAVPHVFLLHKITLEDLTD